MDPKEVTSPFLSCHPGCSSRIYVTGSHANHAGLKKCQCVSAVVVDMTNACMVQGVFPSPEMCVAFSQEIVARGSNVSKAVIGGDKASSWI